MSEDEQIRRLLANDLARAPSDDGARILAAVETGRDKRSAARAIVVAAIALATLAALAILYALAAQVLPPLVGVGEAALLWAPVGVVAAMIVGVACIAVSAALTGRR